MARAEDQSLVHFLADIRACTLCAEHLPLGPSPVLQVHPNARILIAAQAPGRKAHASGMPFTDASGDRLRAWLDMDIATFYDPERVAIVPMGFCYPGTGKAGDLPPRPECAETWRAPVLARLANLELTLVMGQYALGYHLPNSGKTVTERVSRWREHWPSVVPLPHPSPRNNRWLRRNPWFEEEVVPAIRRRVREILDGSQDGGSKSTAC